MTPIPTPQKPALALLTLSFALLTAFALTACAQLDVVGRDSVTAFDQILAVPSVDIQASTANNAWSLTAPDRTARFIWSNDYHTSPLYDVFIEVDAQPFIDAGLDINKLPTNIVIQNNKLLVGTKLDTAAAQAPSNPTALAAYEQIVAQSPNTIGYHAALDHFGVSLGDGNMFEWAKDVATNDKDIVFVLNPTPLIAAGVDPTAVKGWVFAKVPMMMNGQEVQEDKLLKPFDLR
ncbi:MAG: hypothetical protein LBS58_04355 [Coriobacteriales bacterium]|jgi:hypothetical protein|nr:hypothetical protein [Coriobacteriales bacterium]